MVVKVQMLLICLFVYDNISLACSPDRMSISGDSSSRAAETTKSKKMYKKCIVQGEGHHEFEEDESDDGDIMDSGNDGDFHSDDEATLEDVDESGRIGYKSERRPQTRHTGCPCGLNLQPMQTSPRAASPEEGNHMEQTRPVRTEARSTTEDGENGPHDVEMRDGSEDEGQDKSHFIVRAWVSLNGTSDGLDSTIYLMRPDYRFSWECHNTREQDRRGVVRTRDDLDEDDILSVHTGNVWSKQSSHRVSDTSNASGPRG